MSAPTEQRKLAAIIATGMVDFSALRRRGWVQVEFNTGTNLGNPLKGEHMDRSKLSEQPAVYTSGSAPAIPAEWLAEFEAAARRPLETRFRYAFIQLKNGPFDLDLIFAPDGRSR